MTWQPLLRIKYLWELKQEITWALKHASAFVNSQIDRLLEDDPEVKPDLPVERMRFLAGASLLFGSSYARLMGKPLTGKQEDQFLLQGMINPLLDDLFDRHHYPISSVRKWLRQSSAPTETVEVQWLIRWWNELLQDAFSKNYILHYAEQIIEAQELSRAQQDQELPFDQVQQITYEKGATALLFWRSLLSDPIAPMEREFLSELGDLLQWINDVFDVYKDREAGIRSLFTFPEHWHSLQVAYAQKWKYVFTLLKKQGFSASESSAFAARLDFLALRGKIAIDQLVSLRDQFPEHTLDMFSRGQLICDMEKPGNLSRQVLRYLLA